MGILSLETHGEVTSNLKRRRVYVNAIGYRKFVERLPSGKPIPLGPYRYAAYVQLPGIPKAEEKQKENPQAIHTMIQLWDGRNALYQGNRSTLEGAIYWELNPWMAEEYGKIKVYAHPIKLVETGIRLTPDTEWHRFELSVDLDRKRYISIKIDGQKKKLSGIPLAEVKHTDWGNEVALIITTESLAAWSDKGAARFTWTTRFKDLELFRVAVANRR